MSKSKSSKQALSPEERSDLFTKLKKRFEKNMSRHEGLEWVKVQKKLESKVEKLSTLNEMEETGGETNEVAISKLSKIIFFMQRVLR